MPSEHHKRIVSRLRFVDPEVQAIVDELRSNRERIEDLIAGNLPWSMEEEKDRLIRLEKRINRISRRDNIHKKENKIKAVVKQIKTIFNLN